METDSKFKSAESYRLYKEAEEQRINALRSKLIAESENKVVSYLTNKHGSVKLYRESKPTLTVRKSSNDCPIFEGQIEVFAEISAGPAAKKVSMSANIIHSTVSLPKFKFIDHLVEVAKTEGELREVLPPKPELPQAEIEANLGQFRIVDSGQKVLDVYHTILDTVVLGKITREEFDQSDKTPFVTVGSKGVFSKNHSQKVLANKAFEIVDSDGDLVNLKVGNVSGWLSRKDLNLEIENKAVSKKEDLKLGDRVLITAALTEYFGDTVTAKDLVNKEGTVARISGKELVLSVDNIIEEVSLPIEQKAALHIVEESKAEKVPVKLESILRDMICDRFIEGQTIKFIGKFKVPEIILNTAPLQEIYKVAQEEEKPMIPKESELKFKQADGFAQHMSFEIQKIANKKRSLTYKVSSELANILSKIYGSVKILSTSDILDYDMDKGYSGIVKVETELLDGRGVKRVAFDILFKEDKYELPKEADFSKLISSTISEQEKYMVESNKELKAKMDAIDAEATYDKNRVEAALRPEVIEKKAQGFMQPPEMSVSPVLYINKAFLPQSLQVGSVLDIDGLRYRLISKSNNQNSKGPEDSPQWCFEHVYSTDDSSPKYHIKNY